MNNQELITKLKEKIEKFGNAETNDIYDNGYFAGVVEVCEELLSELEPHTRYPHNENFWYCTIHNCFETRKAN